MRFELPRLTTALVAGFTIGATIPTDLAGQTTLGVRGGVSVSSASVDLGETFDKGNRTGFAGGAFVDLGGSRPLGLQIGVQYTQMGVDLDVGQAVDEFSLDYLVIPAVVKLGIPLGGLKPSVFAGAGLGFNTGCDLAGVDCGDEITGTELHGIIGADLALYLEGVSLFFDGRYNVGLNDVIDTDSYAIDELKNRAWTLQAGLGFALGGR
ncbi:MAG: porin family protein [Gemmatimonadota bacterium]|jgi:hypothetical protein